MSAFPDRSIESPRSFTRSPLHGFDFMLEFADGSAADVWVEADDRDVTVLRLDGPNRWDEVGEAEAEPASWRKMMAKAGF